MEISIKTLCAFALAALVRVAHAGPFDGPEIAGEWSPLYDGDIVAVHMVMMPTGKVLTYEEGGQGAPVVDEIRIWDPLTLELTTPTFPPYDLFCSGHSVLPDGRIFIQGGQDGGDAIGEARATIYDPFTDTWDDTIPKMNAGRWYSTNTILPNGDVLVLNGAIDSYANKNLLPQIWELQTKTWRNLVDAEEAAPMGLDFYPRMFVTPDGGVFKAGPDRDSWFLDTSGTGQWTRGPNMNWDGGGNGFRGYSSTVMYDEGKIMTVGGGEQPPTATAEVIDLNDANPQWQYVAPMNHARRHLVATLLADGTVLVTGGTASSGFNNGAEAVRIAEIWDPATNQWSEMAPQTNARVYHSTAVLLPDGRVQIGGGGRPAADGGVDNPNLEIYSPPYLFQGPRPVIINAPEAVSFAETFDVEMNNPEAITAVHLIRLGATTHAFNQTQSINKLDWTVTADGLSVTAPADPNRAQPGYYMLFVLADGVPSVSKMVKFGDAEAPSVPAGLATTNVTPTSVALAWNGSLDNIAVASYNVYRNGTYVTNVAQTAASINGLLSNTQYSFTVAAVDLFGNLSAPSTPLLVQTAQPGQNPPVANAGADQLAAVNINFTLDGTASSDIDGQLLTYEWYLAGALVGTTPVLQESAAAAGTYVYTLSVSDGALVGTDQVTVTVVDAINMLENGDFSAGLAGWTTEAMQGGNAQYSVENGEFHAAVNAAGDAYWALQLFQPQALVEGETYTLDFDARTDAAPRSFTLMVEHNGGDYTKYLIENVTITETQGMQHYSFEWQQNADDNNVKIGFYLGDAGVSDIWFDNIFLRRGEVVNAAPVANAGENVSGFVEDTITLNGAASQDADNGPAALSYFWSQTSGPATTLINDTTVSPSFTPVETGNYIFSLIVNDGELDSTADEVLITIGNVPNEQPIARAGADRMATVGDTISLSGALSFDTDNGPEPLAYQWTRVGGPAATLNAPQTVSPSFTPASSGSYVFGLVVNDGELNSVMDTIIITVNDANIAPVANAGGDKVAYVGGEVLLDGSRSLDPDSGPLALTFNWEQVSGPAVVLENSTQVAPTFTADEVGTYTFSLFVFDGNLVSLADTVAIDVQAIPNIAPIAFAGNAQQANLDELVVLEGGDSFDPDSTGALSFSWTQISGPAVTLINATSATPSFTAAAEGVYRFNLVVNDGELNSTDRALDASRSLLVTDKAILEQFSMQAVLQKLLDDSFDQNQTPADIIIDLANKRQNCGEFNGFPQQDNSNTPDFCSEAGANLDLFEAGSDAGLSYYTPIALVNRFDLAMPDGSDCGEYRISFAGNNIFEPRVNFFIFEAKMPNPNPQLGLEGCRPIVEYWANLTHERDINVRAQALYRFFFEGVEGFDPAIQADHFLGSHQGSGSMRLNARVDQTSNWVFMQFHNETAENCAPLCTFDMVQAPLEDAPFPELAGDATGLPAAQVFQDAVIDSLQSPGEQLLAPTISALSIELPESVYLGRQHSPLTPAQSVADFASLAFIEAIQTQLDAVGSQLTPENILHRVHSLSCGGCHNQHSENLGAPLVLNTGAQLVEFLSINEEPGPDGQRFTVKPAMLDVFLPEREAIILDYLDQGQVAITVTEVANIAPIANAGMAQTVMANTLVTLDGTGSSDADNAPQAVLDYSWQQSAGPVVSLVNATSSTPNFTPQVAGVYRFDLVVSDGVAFSAVDSVVITVEAIANIAPIANAGVNQTVMVNTLVVLDGTGSSDADNAPQAVLDYSWLQSAGPVISLANAASSTPSFTPSAAGVYQFDLVVSDGEATSPVASVAITVEADDTIVDSDNDGVPDSRDSCVTVGTDVDVNGCALINSLRFEAEDYEGFNDTTAGNEGNQYRNDNVDVEIAADIGGGFNVGWIAAGEWLQYTVNLSQGTYAVNVRVASAMGGGAYTLAIDGQVVATDTVGNTGGWQAWDTNNLGNISVAGGEHVIRINISGGNFNINWLEFLAVNLIIDGDRDGITDDIDQCPNSAVNEAVDATGCVAIIDSDNDGVSDELDQCANTPANVQVDSEGCELPDADGDGVTDALDLCPNSEAGETVDANGCLVLSDGDNDGVVDSLDACPQTPAGDTVDNSGCSIVTQLRVEAEDYTDYADTSAGNSGNAYRTDNVDIEAAADAGGGFNVGWTAAGEWLEYRVTLSAGTYALDARVASSPGGGAYTVIIDGDVIVSDNVGATGGWQSWQTHNLGTFTVDAGEHLVRINITQGAFNLNWLDFTAVE